MKSRDFCYWLQGFFEINDADDTRALLTKPREAMIRKHLALVFKHEIDAGMPSAELDAIHAGPPGPPGPAGLPGASPHDMVYRC